MFKIRRLFDDRIIMICDTIERANEALMSLKTQGKLAYIDG